MQNQEQRKRYRALRVRLARARDIAKLSATELDKRCGVRIGTTRDIEAGITQNPNALFLALVALLLNTTTDWLLGIEGTPKKKEGR